MFVIKTKGVKADKDVSEFAQGEIDKQPLIGSKINSEFGVNLINFNPGAKIIKHTHEFGQILYVTSGKGIVATDKEERVVTPGTIVFFQPGEIHWHGATADSSFSHISISRLYDIRKA